MKSNKKMKKYFILPIITIAILAIAAIIFVASPETRNFINGLITGSSVQQEKYYLTGQIKATTPVEIYDNCSINIELLNEMTKEMSIESIPAQEFKEKARMTKDGDFFIYIAELSDLTEDILFDKGSYFITLKVFCGEDLISQTQEYFSI